ncbi:stage II sporulation protein D [Paenibacillus sp. HN-1]|uniref:stage II sporulation protein D n=1 Tax=Paenibacillus TaxID=44249 RepID=UPI001CA92319|nr:MULTISPECIES: stage II sporulation protein D [Paenibacillus]MBY9077639.1 stage II sporulation protein D [Paenibacillus sp. CGMCC 1.18879]MBY9087436.1 stage II sporulation protein D [Paenibacillus sinensis]
MKDFRTWSLRAARKLRRRRLRLGRRRPSPRPRSRLAAAAWLAAPLLAGLLLPLAVVHLHHGTAQPGPGGPKPAASAAAGPSAAPEAEAAQPKVSVYLSATGQIETLPLEDYVTGVVAAEMPVSFELEALKAQAVAARTFILRRLLAGDHSGVPGGAADVTDTVAHQAYLSSAELERRFTKAGRSDDLAKLRRAALETRGVVMTYRGAPITASFFSSSGGYTENSEDYWKNAVPYLRSVASPWDRDVDPQLAMTATFTPAELREKLGVSSQGASEVAMTGQGVRLRPVPLAAESGGSGMPVMKILSVTAGHRVKEISIDGQVFTGREVREKLGLRSSQFTWMIKDGSIAITTYGNGHGVGMSQWGADGMAKEGATATAILKHYYSGISFTQVSTLLKK